ncbi:hypothetical protein R5R35_009235 [Gryllus longicercus]|uniref:Heat shock 70 kDa protein 14 n=1 Tax=Gryllus longicercus TaxID=2509291 RepID=A0AAN9Z4L0_9ORTH
MAKTQFETSVFGIHLGNTSACLASYKDGKAQIIANDVGDRITPAVVAVTDTEKVVGTSAKAGIARNNTSTVVHNKRLLNNNVDDETLSNIGNKTPYKITKDGNVLKYILKHGERTFSVTPESVAVSIFTKLFEIASSSGKFDNDLKAVLCCPLNYPQSSRCTLMRAAEEAGFEVLQVISEPAATALAYSIGVQNPEEELMCLVYRVGGATLDVSIVEERSGMYSVRQSTHLPDLGGDRFTTMLAEYLAEEYRKKCKLDPFESRRSMAKLTSAAETCKHVLSTMGTAHCFVESLCEGVDFSYNITRARFESLISPIIHQYINPIKEILQKAKMENKRIQKVLLSGGCVKVPKLQQVLREVFPNAEFVNSLSPDEVIAIGAARHASYLSSAIDPECQHLWREIPAVAAPIFFRGNGIDEQCIIRGMTPVPVRRCKKFFVEPAEEAFVELVEIPTDVLTTRGILGKLSLGQVLTQVEVCLEVSVNSVGGLSAVLTDSSGQKKATLKLDPPQE